MPQSGPALLICEVLGAEPERSTCRARVPRDSPFRAGEPGCELVPAFLALEMGAQAAAVLEARRAADGARRAPRGFVVGARDARFHSATLAADASFVVVATLLDHAPPLRVYRFEVREGERCVAEGVVSTYSDAPVDGGDAQTSAAP